jgi:hypothetical protein
MLTSIRPFFPSSSIAQLNPPVALQSTPHFLLCDFRPLIRPHLASSTIS